MLERMFCTQFSHDHSLLGLDKLFGVDKRVHHSTRHVYIRSMGKFDYPIRIAIVIDRRH